MVNAYWLFTIKDEDEVFEKRIKGKTWPLYNRTRLRRSILPGDKIIFYKAGSNGQKFLGKAEIKSEVKKIKLLTFSVKLKNIKIWDKEVRITKLLHDLSFIKNPNFWGVYLQGGIIRMTERDHDTIVSYSKK